jgi:DNA adenine methylase
VLLRKERSYSEVYNDLDGEIVNLFRVARDHGEDLIKLLAMTPFAREEFRLSYDVADNPIEQARRTVVRSFMGFGSNSHNRKTGFRSNSDRSGTTPAHDWKNYPIALDKIIDRLRGVVIENRDALDVLKIHDSGKTLHYVDPPYLPETRDPGVDYRYEMSVDDHIKLSVALRSLIGTVIISGYPSELYNNLYHDWIRCDKNALADKARKRIECIWINRKINELF